VLTCRSAKWHNWWACYQSIPYNSPAHHAL
jgi:hypothetical protein